MEYSHDRYEEPKPPISTQLFQEVNQSATVEIDLAEYLPMFKSANTARIPRNSPDYVTFKKAHTAIF